MGSGPWLLLPIPIPVDPAPFIAWGNIEFYFGFSDSAECYCVVLCCVVLCCDVFCLRVILLCIIEIVRSDVQ